MNQLTKFNLIGEVSVHLGAKSLIPYLLVMVSISWWGGWFFQNQTKLSYLFSIFSTIVCIFFYFINRVHSYRSLVFREKSILVNFIYKPEEEIYFSDIEKVFCHHDGPVQIYYFSSGDRKSFYFITLKDRLDHKFLDYLVESGLEFVGANYRAFQPKGPNKN